MNDISKGKNNEISKQAYEVIKGGRVKLRDKVLSMIDGMASTIEIAERLGKPIHSISGRFTELKIENKIKAIDSKKIGNTSYTIYKAI